MARHILVVDDDLSFRETVRDILEVAGYRVTLLSHSDHVPAMVAETHADLVVLDFVMPHRQAPEVIAELRALHNTVPILLVTGLPIDGDSLGGHALLHKPFDMMDFLDKVQDLLGE